MRPEEMTLDEYLPFGEIPVGHFQVFRPFSEGDAAWGPTVRLKLPGSAEFLFGGITFTTAPETKTVQQAEIELFAESLGKKALYVEFEHVWEIVSL